MFLLLLFLLVSQTLGMCDLKQAFKCDGATQNMMWMTDYTRLAQKKTAARSQVYNVNHSGAMWCKKMCEYVGLTGCCMYEVDNSNCFFQKAGKVVGDDQFKWIYKKGTLNRDRKDYQRWGGLCTWTSNQDHFMIYYDRGTSCDWDGRDKLGRKTLYGGGHSQKECTDFCLNDPDCVFASLSLDSDTTSKGYCHTFRTCNYYLSTGRKRFNMWQKVDKSAPYKWLDDRQLNSLNLGQRCTMDAHCQSNNCGMPSNPDGWAECQKSGAGVGKETGVGEEEKAVGGVKYFGDPTLKDEPRFRKMAIEGRWNKYGIYHLAEGVPSDESCDGQWVQTEIKGFLNYDWGRMDGFRACSGVHPIKYNKDSAVSPIRFCCPDFPYTKLAKKCDRNDKNYGCNKFAKEWKKDGICDLEECGNCPAMWDKNKFDGGDCGYVEWDTAVEQTASVAMKTSTPTTQGQPSAAVQGFALLGLGCMLYGAARFYLNK